jgi:hypothetical protein
MADASLLPLSADEKVALVAELKRLIEEDRYPLSPRVQTLTAMRSEGKSLMYIRDVMRGRGFQISHNLVANTCARHAAGGTA